MDSDDVNKLDAIIDVTAWDSTNVVVLMTQETDVRFAYVSRTFRAIGGYPSRLEVGVGLQWHDGAPV